MDSEKTSEKEEIIYYNMNVPGWFMDKSLEEKCSIVKNLVNDLKDEKPLTDKDWDDLLPEE